MVAALGVVMAVALISAVPLFSTVSLTAGLRAVLNATPQDHEVFLSANARGLDKQSFAQLIDQPLHDFIRQQLGSYISTPPEFILQTPGIDMIASTPGKGSDQMALLGFDPQQAASHARVLQGRLPQPTSADLEIALNQHTADALHAAVGATISLNFSYQGAEPQTITLHVVGIFAPNSNDPFWQGYSFDPTPEGAFISYTALMSTNTFLGMLTRIGNGSAVLFYENQEPLLNWYYYLDVNRISINGLDDLIARLASAQTQLANIFANYGQVYLFEHAQLSGPALETYGAPSTIERYRDRASAVTIPADILAVQILALVLFFISMIADLLVERQAEAIALLRSRGASHHQIFGSFVAQSIGVGLLALVVGPLLAIPTARLLGQRMLAPVDQNALNVLDGNLFQVAWSVRWYALAAAVCAVIAMILAVRGSASQDVLTLRREAARATRRPLWRRLNLDIVLIIIALTGFFLSLYATNSGAVNAKTNLLIATPLALVAPILLVVAGVLLFLRFFPLLLRLAAWLAAKHPAAPSMVAIAQMARAPRQAIRMILLLALASGFGIFTLIFNASQAQQIANITAYQVGADFSGVIPASTANQPSLTQQTAAYRHIPGVTSATLGYSAQAVPASTSENFQVEVRAVDTSTYAQTVIWTNQDSLQPLALLMKELITQDHSAPYPIPAIVDALTWKALDLSTGAVFSLALPSSTVAVAFAAIDEVQHIPTVNDSLAAGTSDYAPPGGILLDYQTFVNGYGSLTRAALQANQVWLRTTDDPGMLTNIRATLSKGPLALNAVSDRRVMLAQAESDPLYINLIGVLALGAATTTFLALAGNLITSWLSAKSRLTSFALLRALGSTPDQLAKMLAFEQGIIYSAAIGLGVVFGGLLAATVVPALVFSSTPQAQGISSGEFYVIQRVLSAQVVLPFSLLIALALLILLCIIALGMMARIVSKPSIGQTLRLNED
ncbi:MAG TPA: FtsX-like permease family protein [Ktedonobacterales bacterium]|nr:FtsX-like permease family protein [Ktedonobacterales bacterium]